MAAPDARDGSVTIHADAVLYAGLFDRGEAAQLTLAEGRHAWVQVARGSLRVNGQELTAGDGAAISEVSRLELEGIERAEVLVFDLA